MLKIFDFNHPFFKPLWIRIAVVAFSAAWGTFELVMGAQIWGYFFLGMAALSFYGLFITFEPREPEQEKTDGE